MKRYNFEESDDTGVLTKTLVEHPYGVYVKFKDAYAVIEDLKDEIQSLHEDNAGESI